MTGKTIDLDQHRGMASQKATNLRRLLADVEANEKALRARQEVLETHLLAAPARNWPEAAEKARYLLKLFSSTLAAEDPRRQKLIAAVLTDFERLADEGQHVEPLPKARGTVKNPSLQAHRTLFAPAHRQTWLRRKFSPGLHRRREGGSPHPAPHSAPIA
jgi:hypothetical protein